MTIREWLTPDFFAVLVVLIGLMMNFGLMATLSNFLEDFHIPRRVQTAVFAWAVLAFIIYLGETIAAATGLFPLETTLYPNPYDFLLVGKTNVLVALVAGLVGGALTGWLLGDKDRWWKGLGVGAFGVYLGIVAGVILWLTHQT